MYFINPFQREYWRENGLHLKKRLHKLQTKENCEPFFSVQISSTFRCKSKHPGTKALNIKISKTIDKLSERCSMQRFQKKFPFSALSFRLFLSEIYIISRITISR